VPLSLRTLSVVLLAGFLFAILLTQGSAEPPVLEPPASEPLAPEEPRAAEEAIFPADAFVPAEPRSPDARDARTMKAIRDAMNGEFAPGGSGDPILDDVLSGLMGKQSIAGQLGAGLFPEDETLAKTQEAEQINRKANAAEKILRAARLLEGVGETSSEQSDLIAEMRAEAKRLL
jgi:hypothetical protein